MNEPALCAICRQIATARDEARVVIDCERCGKYRLDAGGLAEIKSRANQGANPWLKLIASANAGRCRLTIPDGALIPLDDDFDVTRTREFPD